MRHPKPARQIVGGPLPIAWLLVVEILFCHGSICDGTCVRERSGAKRTTEAKPAA